MAAKGEVLVTPYYEHAGITIYHADARDVLPDIDASAFVADPPYGVGLSARTTKHSIRKGSYTQFEDTEEYVNGVCVPIVESMIRKGWRGCVTSGTRCMWSYPRATDVGVIWCPSGAGRTRWGFNCSHPILYYGTDPHVSNGCLPSGFQFVGTSEENGHPCPKPLKVMRWLVARVSHERETVVDPFMGSGTTLRACKDTNRRAIGIEIEERYCEIAAKRMAQEKLL